MVNRGIGAQLMMLSRVIILRADWTASDQLFWNRKLTFVKLVNLLNLTLDQGLGLKKEPNPEAPTPAAPLLSNRGATVSQCP